jgi:hypothetical protein
LHHPIFLHHHLHFVLTSLQTWRIILSMTRDYRADFRAEEVNLIKLLKEQEELEVKIARQKKRLAALAELCNDNEIAEPPDLDLGGLSDAVRTAMRASRKEWLTTADIQGLLRELGFPLNEYKAPAASITTTVNRMVDGGEVVASPRSQAGATEYKWVGKVLGRVELLRKGEELMRGKK